jgi:hypothetical protein
VGAISQEVILCLQFSYPFELGRTLDKGAPGERRRHDGPQLMHKPLGRISPLAYVLLPGDIGA